MSLSLLGFAYVKVKTLHPVPVANCLSRCYEFDPLFTSRSFIGKEEEYAGSFLLSFAQNDEIHGTAAIDENYMCVALEMARLPLPTVPCIPFPPLPLSCVCGERGGER